MEVMFNFDAKLPFQSFFCRFLVLTSLHPLSFLKTLFITLVSILFFYNDCNSFLINCEVHYFIEFGLNTSQSFVCFSMITLYDEHYCHFRDMVSRKRLYPAAELNVFNKLIIINYHYTSLTFTRVGRVEGHCNLVFCVYNYYLINMFPNHTCGEGSALHVHFY